MLIVLDTNVLQSDLHLKGNGIQVLLDYVARTKATVALPRIVLQELEWNYRRLLVEHSDRVAKAFSGLNRVSLEAREWDTPVDVEGEVDRYMRFVQDRLGEPLIFEPTVKNFEDAIARSVSRRRPCSSKGEEIRDAVIWSLIIDQLAKAKDVVFISLNGGEFGVEGKLHPDLEGELQALSGNLDYVTSLGDFARNHASVIDFVTAEWIENQIGGDYVLDQVRDSLMDAAALHARSLGFDSDDVDDFEFETGGLEPDEFFVYVMRNGELRLHVDWFGRAEVAYRAVMRSRSNEGSWWFDYSSNDYLWSPREPAWERHMVDLTIRASTTGIIKDRKVVEWTVMNSSADPG
jgi:hypothetical protein